MAKKYDLKLKGYVGGFDFDSDYVDWFLNKNKGRSITVVIDSTGGSVITAMSVAAAMKMHGDVTVHYVGYNASAATIASMGAKRVTIDRHAMYLVHKCSQWVCKIAQANADQIDAMIKQLDQSKQQLNKIDLNIAGMYASRCKKSKAELLGLMAVGGWLSAEEALAWGFVDEIVDVDDEEAEAQLPAKHVNAMLEAHGLPPIGNAERQQSGIMKRVLDAVKTCFAAADGESSSYTNSLIDNMAKLLPLICAAIGVENLAFAGGKTSLTEAQAEALENALAAKDSKIAELQASVDSKTAEIENFKKAPAEESKQVIDSGSKDSEPDTFADLLKAANDARSMFDAIS